MVVSLLCTFKSIYSKPMFIHIFDEYLAPSNALIFKHCRHLLILAGVAVEIMCTCSEWTQKSFVAVYVN